MDNPQHGRRRRSKIVLFPLPYQGHINPMIQLAHILHSKGFTITIIHTKFNSPDPSKYPHFTFHLISDGLSSDSDGKSAPPISDTVLQIKCLLASCVEPVRHCLARLLSDGDAGECPPVACLITDAFWYFTQAVADDLSVPRIVLRTGGVCSFSIFTALPLLRERGYLSDMDSKMEAAIVELPPLKVADIPVMQSPYSGDMIGIINNMVAETKKASGLIFNTFKELEEPDLAKLHEQLLLPTYAIGPFHKCVSAPTSSYLAQDRSSLSWLDAQAPKSVLYVSFGSLAATDGEKLHEVAWGLANSMQPFLWVVRPGLVQGSEWQEILPNEFLNSVRERSYIVKWTPQQEVLSHPAVGGFWTHCGWNSTLESICGGVPMVCSPFFGDQMVNARYISDVWKIGINLEKVMAREGIEDAIRKLMAGIEGSDMRKRIICLKEKVDVCFSLGSSSYQSLDCLVDSILSFRSSA